VRAGVAGRRDDASSCPWLTSTASPAQRADQLLAAMTPLQESTMLHLLQIGTGGVHYEGFTPAIPSLCIPMITEQDGAAGTAIRMNDVTQLPDPIVDAAAFDPRLATAYGTVIGAEDAAKGVDMALGPTVNI